MGYRAASWVSFWLMAIVPAVAAAQPAREAPRPDQEEERATARAREEYERGRALFQSGQFGQALAAFQAAFEARQHPTVLLPIAECQERMGDLRAAVATLQRYVVAAPDASDAPRVQERIAELRGRPAKLRLATSPPGASIRLDGQDTGQVTPAELEASPGTHSVELELEGHRATSEDVTVEFAEVREMSVTLEEEPSETAPGSQARAGRGGGGRGPGGYMAAGFGAVALVTGSVLGVLALGAQSDFEADPTEEGADRAERLALFSDIAFGLAVAAGITAAVALFTGGDDSSEDDEASGPRLRLAATGVHLDF
ncbi:MAG: PEGA domain-containing protein [Deltaproteobacteria bacterium]|nr:PEGA domain-containing protein [Deltaproteobacteria bacterium]